VALAFSFYPQIWRQPLGEIPNPTGGKPWSGRRPSRLRGRAGRSAQRSPFLASRRPRHTLWRSRRGGKAAPARSSRRRHDDRSGFGLGLHQPINGADAAIHIECGQGRWRPLARTLPNIPPRLVVEPKAPSNVGIRKWPAPLKRAARVDRRDLSEMEEGDNCEVCQSPGSFRFLAWPARPEAMKASRQG
jgi:hypothetical protein